MADVNQEVDTEVQTTDEGTDLPESGALGLEGDAEVTDEGAAEGASTDEGTTGEGEVPGAAQAKSIFAQLQEEDEAPSKEQAEELPPDVKPGSRAAETITNLRARAQRAESEQTNLQSQLGQTQNKVQEWASQIQEQMQQLREENVALKTQVKMLPQIGARPKSDAETYMDDLTNQIRQKVASEEVSPLVEKLNALEKKLADQEAQGKAAARSAETAKIARNYETEAADLWTKTVMRGVPPEVASASKNYGYSMILSAVAANPMLSMPQAAAFVRRTILESADLISRHASVSLKEKLKTGKNAPTAVPRGAAGGKGGEPTPDMDTLIANGWDSPIDWKEAGRPKLKPVKRS
jgi:hypothetical protein